jgi:hypothetical protein
MKPCLREKFMTTKTCSPYFRRKSTLLIYGKYNDYYIYNPRGKNSGTVKILYLKSNQPLYPAA